MQNAVIRKICDARVRFGAIRYLPQNYRRDQIAAGMKALAAQVMIWAEPSERTAERAEHLVVDTTADARMFRNDLHNMSLLDESNIERGNVETGKWTSFCNVDIF